MAARHDSRLRARRPLAVLAIAAFALGLGGGAVRAQEEPAGGQTGEELFGGYELISRGNGVQLTYDTPGSFPVASPIFQATVPEALATLSGGPTAAALSSVAYPGPVIADVGALLDVASGQQTGIPRYPIASRAAYPSGPEADEQKQPDGTTMSSKTTATSANALASYSGAKAPPAVEFGSLLSTADSSIVDKQAVSRARSVASNVRIIDGLFTIDSVTTDLVAGTDGQGGATSGATTVSGMRFLGAAVVVDRDGMRLAEAPAAGPAPPALGGLTGGLAPAADALNGLLAKVREQQAGLLDETLAKAGITVRLLDPIETLSGSTASRTANGLSITFSYDGSKQEAMNQLVNLIPPDFRGNIGGQVPNPVNFLVANHIGGMAIAPVSVSSSTSPSFVADDLLPLDAVTAPGGDLGSSGFDSSVTPGFDSALPPLESAAGGGGGGAGTSIDGQPISTGLGDAIPAALVIFLVITSPFFAMGSSKLADNVLNVAETSCPLGLEQPPDPS